MSKEQLLKYMVDWLEEICQKYEEEVFEDKVRQAEIDMLEHLIGKFSA